MWWVFFKFAKMTGFYVLFGLVSGLMLGLVFVASAPLGASAWSLSAAPKHESSDVKVHHSNPCSGSYNLIAVSGEGSISACIMGENIRVASYFSAQGGVVYAISYPFDDIFYRLDVCQGRWGCVYAEYNDTFVSFAGVYKSFAANLDKNIQAGAVHYVPNGNTFVFPVNQFAGKAFVPKTVATSRNGKWVLVELSGHGFVRINVQTQEVRRIIAPGIDYGYGSDPLIEMTISNDGSTVAVAGLRMGLQVVGIDETCGDKPNEFMQKYYMGAVNACNYLPISASSYISAFVYALRPVFSVDNMTLSFDVFSNIAAPRRITLFSDANVTLDTVRYLALGDSFTSGEGETDDSYYIGGAANKCHTSTRSYPFLLASFWDISGNSTACSGATMQSARSQPVRFNRPSQFKELESQTPDIATVGLGGNDAGLIGKLKDCLGLDTCKWASSAGHRRSTGLEIKNLYPRLKQFYVDMKTKTLGPVIVVGYPRIVSVQANCSSTIGILLNQTERIFMNEAVQYLNKVLQAAAIDSGIEYADVEDTFSGSELCTSFESPLVNALRVGQEYPSITALPFIKIIGSESFHPKPEGHVKMATKIFQSFSDLSSVNTYINNGTPTAVPALGSYWDSQETDKKVQLAVPFISKITIKKKDSFEVSFPAFSFKPSSDIVLELHSEVKSLGTVRSAVDGSLDITISRDDFEPGFHSVHAIGKNYAENDIDIYDFLTVEADANPTVNTANTDSGVKHQQKAIPSPMLTLLQNSSAPSLDVLGATTVNTAAPNNPSKAGSGVVQSPKKKASNRYNGLLVALLILSTAAIAVSLYVYNRQKTAV